LRSTAPTWVVTEAVAEHGGVEEVRRFVLRPDLSRHVTGRAVDVAPYEAMHWLSRYGSQWGLCPTCADEDWHFELATTRGGDCPDRCPTPPPGQPAGPTAAEPARTTGTSVQDVAAPTSQNMDQITALATRYIEQHLDGDPLQWNDVIAHLRARDHNDEATQAVLGAVLDLERTDVVFYALDGIRRPRPGDVGPAPLPEVAAAVLDLPWPCTRNDRPGGSRSIWEAFEELGGRYRHCDVYEAMHTLLKGHELKSSRVYWQRTDVPSRFDTAGQFAHRAAGAAALPPSSSIRQKIEADLVGAYVATLPHRYLREHRIGDLKADVYEPTVQRIVEAKSATDVVTVAHAWAQAVAYRYLLNTAATDERTTVETIAVLLPAAPTGNARAFLEHVAADAFEVELIHPEGETFRSERMS